MSMQQPWRSQAIILSEVKSCDWGKVKQVRAWSLWEKHVLSQEAKGIARNKWKTFTLKAKTEDHISGLQRRHVKSHIWVSSKGFFSLSLFFLRNCTFPIPSLVRIIKILVKKKFQYLRNDWTHGFFVIFYHSTNVIIITCGQPENVGKQVNSGILL